MAGAGQIGAWLRGIGFALAVGNAGGAMAAGDGSADLAKRWSAFVADADFNAVSASYRVLADFAGGDGPDAKRCREHRGALDEAREVNPFSPALQSMALRCAERGGDAVALAAERERTRLLQEFLRRDGRGSGSLRPILVPAEADAAMLVEMIGGEPLYGRYDLGSSHGSLPFVAVYFDPALGRERQLVFDFPRLWQQLQSHDAADQYPAMLRSLVRSFLDQAGDGGSVAAELAQIKSGLGDGHDWTEVAERIEGLALSGSVAAAVELLPLCLMFDATGACASDAVDLLQPHAQRGLGEAMVVMALAGDRGVAGAGGRRASARWLQLASARVGTNEALTAFAQLVASLDGKADLETAAGTALRRAARAGHAPAQLLLAQLLREKRIRPLRGERAGTWIERAAASGLGAASAQLGIAALRRGAAGEAWPLLRSAAEGGDPSALGALALAHEHGSIDGESDSGAALGFYRSAASFGNAGAMRRLGRAYASAELGLPRDATRAEAWYLSASLVGNQRAALELAEMYLRGDADVVGRPADGYAVVARLAAEGLTSARLRQARALLLGQGTVADPAEALALLAHLSAEGIAAADFRLGQIREFGEGGVDIDLARARGHYQAAAQAGHLAAIDYYARALYAGRGGDRDRAAAVTWWQKAAREGHAPSIANLAWARCTSSAPEVRDPLAGTRLVSAALQKRQTANLSDTLAVCLAASGLYREAVATQAQTLELAAGDRGLDDAHRRAFAERLALFERGQAWVDSD